MPQFLFSLFLILTGIIEAIWGLGQLYGVAPSHHAQFLLTGSFYNPGPYTGFLAMAFPLTLHEWLRRRKEPKSVVGHGAWAAMLLIGCLIPCGMSRTAWLAVTIGAGYVVAMHKRTRLAGLWRKHRRKMTTAAVLTLTVLVLAAGAAYAMKKDSADGRLLMWKVAARAVMERPLTGYGWDQVAGAYGQAQEDYFASGQATPTEERVAGAPEYVFNEYLQVALAWGFPTLLLGLAAVCGAGCIGHRNKAYGLCGSLLALGVFAFASYPLQFPEFVVAGIGLVAACATSGQSIRRMYAGGLWVLAVASCAVYACNHHKRQTVADRWEATRISYYLENYADAIEAYAPLYEDMKWNPRYLFEYGHALHKERRYEESSEVMKEALRHSSDPMILNIIGKNEQAMKRYMEAEEWLVRSTYRLPNRLYPYYLLAKLYAEPEYARPDKCREIIDLALHWNPKVHSEAIEEMKRELKTLKEHLP